MNDKKLKLTREKILSFSKTGEPASAKLLTDDKVLARVTDGIYRQPGSAIRELISNAYDADAENVIIETDMPRFTTMTIRDDGNGMSIDTFLNLISHIGGSAKRSSKGQDLNITDKEDVNLSPNKKRRLIGKIGIGLFSVAQLTRQFEIITKQKDTDYYLKAMITLHNFADEINEIRGEGFETGDVEIWTEKTKNVLAHGTDIILHSVKKSARDILKSIDIWGQSDAETDFDQESEEQSKDSAKLVIPSFHIGCSYGDDGYEIYDSKPEYKPNLPWGFSDSPEGKFKKLYKSVLELTDTTVNPKLEVDLDHYLNMIWTLALSIPLDYINKHPFEYCKKDFPNTYIISNKVKGQVLELNVPKFEAPFNSYIPFKDKIKTVDFNVEVDGIRLFRPIDLTIVHKSTATVKKPILFFGSYEPSFNTDDIQETGGELSFDAYILWTPKVIPRDHNGVLVRLHNASGIMFDETFMKHQVAEHTIKSQLMIEIFIHKGLDSALNIDRESFNVSHPHYQIVKKWLHQQALRQVINKYKALRKRANAAEKTRRDKETETKLDLLIDESLESRGINSLEKKSLEILSDKKVKLDYDVYKISKADFVQSIGGSSENTARGKEAKLKTQAMFQILDSYGLLDNLQVKKQEALFKDIMNIIGFNGD